jgi:predicted DNA-binding transcriptional regulator YafY
VRTIQRDIDALCQAGFPICAFTGTNGGYEILSDFKMNKQMLQSEVKNKKVVRFSYTNNSGETRQHCVEPIAVIYKWYA